MTPKNGYKTRGDYGGASPFDVAVFVDSLKHASDAEKRELRSELLGMNLSAEAARAASLRETAKHAEQIALRFLKDNADVTDDADGDQVAFPGESFADIVNLIGMTAWWSPHPNARQLNVRGGGGGTDCMFDYIISQCWATEVANGDGVEGQQMRSITGCTFRVYSTLTGAMTHFNAADTPSTMLVCRGTYSSAGMTVDGDDLRIVGAGQDLTILDCTSGTMLAAVNHDGNLEVCDLTIDSVGATGGINGIVTGQRVLVRNVHFVTSSGTNGIDPTTSSGQWQVVDCTFSGTGTAMQAPSNEGAIPFLFTGCTVNTTTGILMSNATDLTCVANKFYCSGTALTFSNGGGHAEIVGNLFTGCTVGIRGGTLANGTLPLNIVGNGFDDCTTAVIIDGSGTSTGHVICVNWFKGSGSQKGIVGHNTALKATIGFNNFRGYTAGNEIQNCGASECAHNKTDSGATLLDTGTGHTSGGGPAAPNDLQYLLLANDGDAPNARAFTPGKNIFATDAGAGAAYTVDGAREGATITPSGGTLTPGTDGDIFHVAAGNFSAIATPTRQTILRLVFDGVSVLTHGASLILQGATNFTAAAGDTMTLFHEGSGVWREINRHTAAAAAAGGGHTIHDEASAALTARAALHFMGAGIAAQDNGGSTRTEVIVGAYYDAIVDNADTNAVGKGNVYATIAAAIAAGHQSIFVRNASDSADITIAGGDSVTRIVGDSTQTAYCPVNLKSDKADVLFQDLQFYDVANTDAKRLWMNGARNIAFGCAYTGALNEPQAQINNGAGITATATSIAYDNGINGSLPTAGIGRIDDEILYWTAGGGAASGTLTGAANRASNTYDCLNTTHADNAVIYSLYSAHLMISAADCQAIACRFVACTSPNSHCVLVRAGGDRARIVSSVFLGNTTFHVIALTGENTTLSPTRGPLNVQLIGNSLDGNQTYEFLIGTLPLEAQSGGATNGAADHAISTQVNGNLFRRFDGGCMKYRSRQWNVAGNTYDGNDFASNVSVPNSLAYQINQGGGIAGGDTTIPYDTATGNGTLAPKGLIKIEDEWIYYGSKSATQFLNCQRGALGSTAAAHADNVAITNYSQRVFYSIGGTGNNVQAHLISGNAIIGATLVYDSRDLLYVCQGMLFSTNQLLKCTLINAQRNSAYCDNLFTVIIFDVRSLPGVTLFGGLPPTTFTNLASDTQIFAPSTQNTPTGLATATYLPTGKTFGYGRVAGDLAGSAIPVTNNTGANSVSGNVVILDAATNNSFVNAGLVRSALVLGVCVQNAVAAGSDALIAVGGVVTVNVDTGAVVVGDMLATSLITAGRASSIAAPAVGQVFAKALTAKAAGANGTVKAVLLSA